MIPVRSPYSHCFLSPLASRWHHTFNYPSKRAICFVLLQFCFLISCDANVLNFGPALSGSVLHFRRREQIEVKTCLFKFYDCKGEARCCVTVQVSKIKNHCSSTVTGLFQVHEVKAPVPKPSILPPPNSGHRSISPSSSSGLTPSPELRQSPLTPPPTLEELRNQLKDLRASIELLKIQHR